MGIIQRVRSRFSSRPAPDAPYDYVRQHTVVRDYAEFSGADVMTVAQRIRDCKKLTRDAWATIISSEHTWEDAARKFYEKHDSYIYDHLLANPTPHEVLAKLDRFHPDILRWIRRYRGKRLLEFGGGTGVFCECMAREGFHVTYLDIPGHVKDYAEWRFQKYGLPIEVITSSPDRLVLTQNYDVVFTDAVFEHLVEPEQALIEIVTHINPGGLFAFIVDLSGPTEDEPEHRYVDIGKLHRMVEEAGFSCQLGRERFASVWRRRD